ATLGVGDVRLMDYPDGKLDVIGLNTLRTDVDGMIDRSHAEMLLVFDEGGITGHPDHTRATEAAIASARGDLPVVAWALPQDITAVLNLEFGTAFCGRPPTELDFRLPVDRATQRRAIACHASQATDNPVLWRRLELLGDKEWLRILHPRGS
ncbi:MAG TPA: PIG-L family deacetylase, partial [Gemmatimonadaceae bacterium]